MNEVSAISRTGTDAGVIIYNEACIFALAAGAAATDVARSPAERVALAEKYATLSVAALADTRRAGYFRDPSKVTDMLSDRDLDPIRPRLDFQMLTLDLAFPSQPFARPP
jgi:hypothetical protein